MQNMMMPRYELEGDEPLDKVIVNSIVRFRLKLIEFSDNFHRNSTVDSFSLGIVDPYGHGIVLQRRVLSADLLELTYQPMSIGSHQLSISFNHRIDQLIKIDVLPEDSNFYSRLRPFGAGLKRAIAGFPAEFYVDLNKTTNQNIHFRLEPSYLAEIDYEQQMATVRYVPTDAGDCPIQILENDRDIINSPFIAHVDKYPQARHKPRVRVFGLPKDLVLHRTVEFQVFIDNPFDDPNPLISVDILTDDDQSPTVSIRRRHRSSYVCSFIPISLGQHWISVDYAGIVAEQNPFICHAIQGKDILLLGPAILNPCLKLNQPTHFSFKLKDLQNLSSNDTNSTYESGYSSNDDISTKSSSSTTSSTMDLRRSVSDSDDNYRVTITDGHGNVKSNISVQEIQGRKNENDIRVDFTPDEKIMYINVSCTW